MISSEGVFGLEYDGKKFDCGSKEGFIDANIFFAKKQNLIS
jgi:UTP-glucose-1-phosphate uridylyltransferase